MNRTRVVRWLRVLLPLAALAMLSTMFLLSRRSDTESRIPYAQVDAEAAAREGRVVAPEYSSVTKDGTTLALRAASVAPRTGGGAGQDLRLDWQRPDGLVAEVAAPSGGMTDGRVWLDGGVTMDTSTGWQIRTRRVEAATALAEIIAPEGIEAEAPFGRIEAGQMRLAPNENAPDEPAILNFFGGVRLIYRP